MDFCDEFLFLEQSLLEILNLCHERDNLAPDTLDNAESLKPTVRPRLAARLQFVEVEHFILEVEIQFAF